MIRIHAVMFAAVLALALAACQAETPPPIAYDPTELRFSGTRAFQIERDFVGQFPNRASGKPNNHLAAEWILQRLTDLGLSCTMDAWQIINYSRPVALNNVVCKLPGESDKEILVTAHLDQAPTTVEGADNDGSGIAIMLTLAEMLAPTRHPYTLAFVATDAEEYGMLGSGRYIATHPHPENVLAHLSLDNLGRTYYDAMNMEIIGQFRGYGPMWLALTARESARAAGAKWVVNLRAPFDQITDQAAPVSLMDQGPLVAAGVPAIGFAGHVPAEMTELHFHLWHDPDDTLQYQSAEALQQSGLIAEALIRQLLAMKSFPEETGPYLYFDDTGQILRGPALWLIFAAFVGLFLFGSIVAAHRSAGGMLRGWRNAVPHFLGLWLPLLASILLLYLLVEVRLMDVYARYPATSKDPLLYHPRWPAVGLFLAGLALFLFAGRRLVGQYSGRLAEPRAQDIKSFSLLVIGLCGLNILATNPFSLLFLVPLLFWLLIWERQGLGRALNVLFFILGGLVVYALIYVFGFVVLRLNLAFLWYMLNMFSIRMISFPTAALITAIISAGLAMIVRVPRAPDHARRPIPSAGE